MSWVIALAWVFGRFRNKKRRKGGSFSAWSTIKRKGGGMRTNSCRVARVRDRVSTKRKRGFAVAFTMFSQVSRNLASPDSRQLIPLVCSSRQKEWRGLFFALRGEVPMYMREGVSRQGEEGRIHALLLVLFGRGRKRYSSCACPGRGRIYPISRYKNGARGRSSFVTNSSDSMRH